MKLTSAGAEDHEYDHSGGFVTALIEMKLDQNTMFEWQRHNQDQIDVPPFAELLEFIDLQAPASENTVQRMIKSIL